jgi:hypothetical protein
LAILSLAYRSVEGGNLFLAQKMFLSAFAAAAGVGGKLFSRILSVVNDMRFFWNMRSNGFTSVIKPHFHIAKSFPTSSFTANSR